MPGKQLCDHLQFNQEQRAPEKRRRQTEDRKGAEGIIKIYREMRVDRDGQPIQEERLEEANTGTDQRITGRSQMEHQIVPRSLLSAMPGQTWEVIQDHSKLHFLSPAPFPLFASSLLLFPGAVCSPSPDFGIKVLPSSSTSNLLSSLFFHYTSPLPL